MTKLFHRRWQLGLLIAVLLAGMLGGARAQTAGCSVSYKVTNEWSGGFQADVTVSNTSATSLNSWALTWTFAGDQKVTNAWNTALVQSGASVTARNVDYNASLPAGGSQSFGFQATFSGTNAAPASFALNGAVCGGPSGATPTPQGPTATSAPATATSVPATPTQAPGGAIQAETAILGGGSAVESTNAGYNGSGYVNFPATGGSLEFRNLDGGAGGSVALRLRVALGATTARTGRVLVNGAAQNVTFSPTGAWTTWVVQTVTANFAPGATNTVRVESTGADVANIDELSVGAPVPVTATPVQPTPTRTPVLPTATPARRPTVYIAGDSTVQTYSASYAPQAGWGQFIANYFTTDVVFVNKAIGGRSSKSFVVEGRLDEILRVIQPNDYLFVQMGHNDATKSRPERYTEPQTTYKQYLKMYLDGARQRGAIPVLITPVGRLNYKNGVFVNDFSAYTTAMKELAAAENVKLIDLMSKSLAYYTSIGYDQTRTLFMVSVNGTDYTHFTEKGANQIARLVSEGVRDINVPISRFKK